MGQGAWLAAERGWSRRQGTLGAPRVCCVGRRARHPPAHNFGCAAVVPRMGGFVRVRCWCARPRVVLRGCAVVSGARGGTELACEGVSEECTGRKLAAAALWPPESVGRHPRLGPSGVVLSSLGQRQILHAYRCHCGRSASVRLSYKHVDALLSAIRGRHGDRDDEGFNPFRSCWCRLRVGASTSTCCCRRRSASVDPGT